MLNPFLSELFLSFLESPLSKKDISTSKSFWSLWILLPLAFGSFLGFSNGLAFGAAVGTVHC